MHETLTSALKQRGFQKVYMRSCRRVTALPVDKDSHRVPVFLVVASVIGNPKKRFY